MSRPVYVGISISWYFFLYGINITIVIQLKSIIPNTAVRSLDIHHLCGINFLFRSVNLILFTILLQASGSSCTYHLITVPVLTLTICHPLSLSLQTSNQTVSQILSSSIHSLSGSIWTAFTDFGLELCPAVLKYYRTRTAVSRAYIIGLRSSLQAACSLLPL